MKGCSKSFSELIFRSVSAITASASSFLEDTLFVVKKAHAMGRKRWFFDPIVS